MSLFFSTYMALTLYLFVCLPVFFAHADTGSAKADIEGEVKNAFADRIVSIRPVASDKGLKVYITGDGEFKDYNAFRIYKPNRFVIDFQNVQSSVKQKTWFVNSPFVKKIRLGTTDNRKVRIVFDLFPVAELPCKLFARGNKLIVGIGPVSTANRPARKIKRFPAKTLFVKRGKVDPGPPKRSPLKAANMITAVKVKKDYRGAKLHIVASREITLYDSLYISAPSQFVVELFDVKSALGKEELLFSDPLVKSVKLITSDKDKTRVVFFLTHAAKAPHLIASKGNQLVYLVERASNLYATGSADNVQSTLPRGTTEQEKETPAMAKSGKEKPLAAVPAGRVMLHVNLFADKVQAAEDVLRLGKLGYDSFYQVIEVSGEKLFGVYVGTFDDEQGAIEVGSELKKKGIISYFKPREMDRNVEVLKRDVSSDEADKKHVGAAKKGKRIYSTERQAESPLAAVIPGKIVLHVSSFKQKVAAEKETQRLGEYGYNTFIGTKEVSGKKSFLVYIGTFQNKRAALKMGSKLRGKGIISYFTPKEMEQNIRLEEQ